MPDRGRNGSKTSASPCSPARSGAMADIGQLLNLGLALGHERFELVNLVNREEVGMVAAHAWAECGGRSSSIGSGRYPDRSASIIPQQHREVRRTTAESTTKTSRPRPPLSQDTFRAPDGQHELHKELEWLRERVENLSRQLMLARRDSGRLAKQLKQEEGLGREQRRRADEAVREAKALREELARLKEGRAASGAASRAALTDAHSRSVRMAERRRRHQAESLMQAYKGLYEDQLQTQLASTESHRSLTRGYSRLSADYKALRQEASIVAGAASAKRSEVDHTTPLVASSSADHVLQTAPPGTAPSSKYGTAVISSGDRRVGAGERRQERNVVLESSAGAGTFLSSGGDLADTVRIASATAEVRLSDEDSCCVTETMRTNAATTAESATAVAAVATAAAAVDEAADALAYAVTTTSSMEGAERVASSSARLREKERGQVGARTDAPARGECERRHSSEKELGASRNICSRNRASGGYSSTQTDCPSTAETIACSPSSDTADGSSCSTTIARERAEGARAEEGDAASYAPGDTTFPDDTALPADDLPVPLGEALINDDDGSSSGSECDADRGSSAKGYAFPQTIEEEGDISTGGLISSASIRGIQDRLAKSGGHMNGGGTSNKQRFVVERLVFDKHCSVEATPQDLATLVKAAVPPVEPVPRWRSGCSVRSLARSVSRAEAADVDAPKRSASPTPPRQAVWGECFGGNAWGGSASDDLGHQCSRIEPSSRPRPHSI